MKNEIFSSKISLKRCVDLYQKKMPGRLQNTLPLCRTCGGSGKVRSYVKVNCPPCNGIGRRGVGFALRCLRCGGTGKIERLDRVNCPKCRGSGRSK